MKTKNDSRKKTLKTVEIIRIKGKAYKARIDTGARTCSICTSLVNKLKLGPYSGTIKVKSSSGNSTRPLIKIKFSLSGKQISALFTVAKREHMSYSILIGRNALKKGFLIDPSK